MPIKIEKVELARIDIPLKEPFKIALDTFTDAQNIFVKIITDQGFTGYGECSPFPVILGETPATCYAVGQQLARVLIGKNPLAIEHCLDELDRLIAGNRCIKSAFDMALYDIAAQYAGLPLYQFLGGGSNKRIKTDMTVSLDEPEIMVNQARRFVEAGFFAIKVKLGRAFPEDVERIIAIRRALGDTISIRIDANQGWSFTTAARILKALEPYRIEYCEAPVPKYLWWRLPELKRASPIPIMADESLFDQYDAMQLVKSDAVDLFNIKLAKSGGIFKALKIINIAESAGMGLQVGCFLESRLAMTALAHLAVAKKQIEHYDMDSPLMHAKDFIHNGIRYQAAGEITLPENIGIGAIIDCSQSKIKTMVG